MDNLEQKLKSLAKDEKSFKELKELFSEVIEEKNKFENHLDLLEKAIRSDYDSILITELGLEKPGPKIVYVNDGFTKMTGYTREEVLGKTPRILQGEKTDRAVLDKLKERLKEGKAFFGHTVNYRKDGSEFINQWDIHPLTNDKGEITHWVSYQHDITERKRSEKKVVDSEMEFDKLREESKKTLIDVDEQGNIVTTNKAFRDLTGYADEELKKFKFWEILKDELIETYKHKFDSFKPSDFNDRSYEMVIKNKKGGPVEVKATARILTVHGQKIVRMSFENKSLQKRIMAMLSKRNANFEKVFERDKDFNYKLIKTAENGYMFEYVSDSFSKITGITSDEAVTLSMDDIIHEDDLKTFHNHLSTVMDGTPNTEQYRIKSKDGGYVEVIDYAKPEWNADRTEVEAIKGATSTEISSEYNSN
ncbi:PAS domain S-box protein [Rhodohalobacter sp.]|uniref:PAS domain-containing protein n=1 Tax=Rhodohalobacter sp. TaxID=1974210 RepID=UPI002ACEA04A|nr:PAS domain S-box protein [Rhodohalobacter sp.]MDZ7758481.1 PAS domain S-box protein [Rhodohalobacter sp.]